MTTATYDKSTAYQPRGAVRDLMYCRDPEVLLEGPAGTGKSRGALEKAHLCAMKYAGARILLLRQTRESMTESVLVTFEEKVIPDGALDPINLHVAREQRHSYDYRNGSSIVVGGFKASGKDLRAKIMSTEYDMIVVFEGTEVSEPDYEQATTRLRNGVMPYQQIIVDCNPDASTHWLNRRANAGQMTRLRSRHEDNPTLYRDGQWTPHGALYIAKLDKLGGHRRLRLREGKWANAEGVVYESYNATTHIIPRFLIPSDWRRIRTIDFGYRNPFVCQWWAIDGDGRMYLYREIYKTGVIVGDHAERINELSRGETFEATIADHDAEDRATLERAGIYTIAAQKDITPGIESVQVRLRIADDGKPRLFIFADALVERDQALEDAKKPCCTAEEFDAYIWPKGQDGKPMKEVPVKEDDHGMDAMRYGSVHLDNGGPWVGVVQVAEDQHEDDDE